jgi:hypothetical protein
MTTVLAPKEQRFVLDGVDWGFYETLLRRIGDRHVFITFDRGRTRTDVAVLDAR